MFLRLQGARIGSVLKSGGYPEESPLLGFLCLQSTGKTAVNAASSEISFRSLQRDQMGFQSATLTGRKLKVFTTSGAADERKPGKETAGPRAQVATLGILKRR